MSSDPKTSRDIVVDARGLGKCYHVYARPHDRLRQLFARKGRRYYTEFWALRDLDLQVYRGETLGIIGRNGAGKSTLLQLIAGTLQPTTGDVRVDGRVTALLELGSGFHGDFTGRENVYVAGALLGLDRDHMDARMEQIESFADIGEFIDRPVKTYSKGMFARLSFSVYANLDPEVFIVDEALAVGDDRFRHKCMYRFKQMRERGIAILYVSHGVEALKHLCDRVAWIDHGRLQQVGEPAPVVDAYLNDLFYGEAPDDSPPVDEGKIEGDDDLGSRKAVFTACGLRDASGQPTDHVVAGQDYEVWMRLRNDELPDDSDPLILGFLISNVQGLAVTGSNTTSPSVAVPTPARGGLVGARFRFTMPPLAPGNYAMSVTAVTLDRAGETTLLHLVPNALTFQATHDRQVFGLVGLDCEIEVESD